MIFPFTFNFSVPGIINPFSLTPSRTGASTSTSVDVQNQTETGSVGIKTPIPRSQPLPQTQPQQLRLIEGLRSQSITPPVLVSRKRGWEPAFAEESSPSTTLENSTGYLVTGMPSEPAEYHEVIDTDELPPPAKRRRGLAGSIVSTAISAALIGTAVGLTVYRLWRDRGKSPTTTNPKSNLDSSSSSRRPQALPPPPPYQESERSPGQPSTLHKQRRQRPVPRTHLHHQNSLSRHRSTRSRGHIPSTLTASSAGCQDAPLLLSNQTGSELGEPQHEVETQMDWFGDKLSVLIAEGKRALGREIVVMSDAKEDEVDDGSGAWEDSDDQMSDSESRTYHSPSQRIPDNTRRRRRLASPTGSINNSPSKTRSSSQRRHQHVVSPLSTASCSSSPNKAGSTFGFESAGPSTTSSIPSSSARGGYFETGVPRLSRHAYSASTSCLPNPVSSSMPYLQPPPSPASPLQWTTPAAPMTPRRTHGSRAYGLSLDSSSSPGWTGSEDLTSLDSPELRDSMERARQKALMTRASRMSLGDGEL